MFKSEPMDKSRGIFFCYYVDRHVNIRRKSSYHDGLNPWYISSHNTLQNKNAFYDVRGRIHLTFSPCYRVNPWLESKFSAMIHEIFFSVF